MVSEFEKYIMSLGYQRYRFKNKKWEKTDRHNFSSLGDVFYRYKKGDSIIDFGLVQKDLPPTISYPTLNIRYNLYTSGLIVSPSDYQVVSRMLESNNVEEVYTKLINQERVEIKIYEDGYSIG